MPRPTTLAEAIALCTPFVQDRIARANAELSSACYSLALETLNTEYAACSSWDLEMVGRMYERIAKTLGKEQRTLRNQCFKSAMTFYERANKHRRSLYIFQHYLFK